MTNRESEPKKENRNAVPILTRGIGTRITAISSRINGGKKELAARAGLSESQLHRIVAGESQAKIETITAIAKAAEVSLDWLATGNGPMRLNDKGVQEERIAYGVSTTPPAGGRVDTDTLRGILQGLAGIEEIEGPLDPQWKARMAAAMYEYLMEKWEHNQPSNKESDIGQVLKMVGKDHQ